MKTTVDIAVPLLRKAKALARREGRTLRDLVEAGLRREIEAAQTEERDFRLRDASVDGAGLSESLRGASFAELLDLSYGDRS
jgi:hypothetical protein